MVRKRLLILLVAVIMLVCSAFAFTACGKADDTGEQGGIQTPINPPQDPQNPPEQEGGGFTGNLPANPNREQSYEAK